MKPWHDSAKCPKCGVQAIQPCSPSPHNLTAAMARHVFCFACGHDYRETDAARLAQIWWSLGAYAGKRADGDL
jgi:hypothetical protein